MNSKEVIRDAVKAVGVVEIADSLGITESKLHNQMHDENHVDLVGQFVDFCKLTGNNKTIDWAAEKLGGHFVPFVELHETDLLESTGEIISKVFADLSKQVRLVGILAERKHLAGANIEKACEEWKEVKLLMEGFLLAVKTADSAK